MRLPLPLILALALCSAPVLHAATVAWKAPIALSLGDPDWQQHARKLDQPPAASAFFQPGDILWDLSEIVDDLCTKSWQASYGPDSKSPAKWQGTWIVWDERSGMIVARGAWDEIFATETALGFSDFSGPGETSAQADFELSTPGGATKHLSIVVPSGEKGAREADGMKVEIEPTIREASQSGMSISCSWHDGGSDWSLGTAIDLRDDQPLRIAQAGGTHPWQLTVRMSRQLADGSPLRKARFVEKDGAVQSRKPGGIWQISDPVDSTFGLAITARMEYLAYSRDPNPGNRPVLKIPPHLTGILGSGLLDISDILHEKGVAIDPARGFLAAYDPSSFRFYFVADQPTLARIGELVGETGAATDLIRIETNAAAGGWGLVCRPGEKAVITRSTSGAEDLWFRVEPVLSPQRSMMDVSYRIAVPGEDAAAVTIDSIATLIPGQPLVAGKSFAGDLQLTATLLPPADDP